MDQADEQDYMELIEKQQKIIDTQHKTVELVATELKRMALINKDAKVLLKRITNLWENANDKGGVRASRNGKNIISIEQGKGK